MPDSEVRQINFRRLANRLGQGITIAALAFLGWELYRQWGKVIDWRPTVGELVVLVLLAFGYGVALTGLAYNWLTILQSQVSSRMAVTPVLRSYTETQIAKYVPGNFMHFVSRHIYLKGLDIPHRPLAFAALLEIISLPLAAVLAIGLLLPFVDISRAGDWAQTSVVFLPALTGLVLAITVFWLKRRGNSNLVRTMLWVLARAVIFMIVQGLIFTAVLWTVSGQYPALAIVLSIMAWLVGFATPGAPGGLGVREALLVTTLGALAHREDILIAVLLFRIVTTLGDLILFYLGRIFLTIEPTAPDPECS